MLLLRKTTLLARALAPISCVYPNQEIHPESLFFVLAAKYFPTQHGVRVWNTNGAASGQVPVTCDLRSDTVTVPCKGMKEAMMAAPVGDDVFGEDPTINNWKGKEAGLFVATGTMSNQLAVRAKIGAMESVVCDARCHIFSYECGGVAYHSQAHMIPVTLPPGHKHLTVETIAPHVLGPDMHHAVTKMILLENTLGGSLFPLAEMQRIKEYAESKDLLVHVDGARLWSACIATNTSLKEYAACADSVSLCLSKTLGAPVGSVLVGTREHIERVDTNMVFADMSDVTERTGLDWAAVAERLRAEGIMIFGPRRGETAKTRLVLHHQAPRHSIERLLSIIQEMIAQAEAKTATQ